jgi:transketolase
MSIVEMVNEINPNGKLVISEGHAGMVVYPLLRERGLITDEDIKNFRKPGGRLTMFPNKSIPGIHASCGSLGCGIGYACGMALADRSTPVTCIISEGELYEGSTWEALMFARHYNLSNLRIIVNKNDAIILGKPSECLDIPWKALEIFPNVEVQQTIKGKGVPAWEGKVGSHYWSDPHATT